MIFERMNAPIILIRGGGDLASGVALRLLRAGFRVLIAELAEPLVVRRLASFAQVIFDGAYRLEEVEGVLVDDLSAAKESMAGGKVAVMVDPDLKLASSLDLFALVDARMLKARTDARLTDAPRVIGLGPGFNVGMNCHAVVETNRGPFLGRVFWQGSAEPDTGIPEAVREFDVKRVLYAPADGILQAQVRIGDLVEKGDLIATINGIEIRAQFRGVLRGLIQPGLKVEKGTKVGDLDPRCDPRLCTLASDKALAVGGGVLEALLTLYQSGEA
jgi:xanthine dehydrogenase accessory factor